MPPKQYPLACQSAGAVPPRPPHSLRRTTSIDVTWPDGFGGPMDMQAKGRDLWTGDKGEHRICDAASLAMRLSAEREILAISSDMDEPALAAMVGARAGGASRKIVNEVGRDWVGRILFQLLDDFAGASLVAGWAWSNWQDIQDRSDADAPAILSRDMTDICVGFSAGGSSLLPGGMVNQQGQSRANTAESARPDDPLAWHDAPVQSGVAFRRARWLDVQLDGENLHFHAGFQDSGTSPQGGRVAVHEYRLRGAMGADGELTALDVTPYVLPYRECPAAAVLAHRVIGERIRNFRQLIIEQLRGTAGCTHLNDMLRSLTDVEFISRYLK